MSSTLAFVGLSEPSLMYVEWLHSSALGRGKDRLRSRARQVQGRSVRHLFGAASASRGAE